MTLEGVEIHQMQRVKGNAGSTEWTAWEQVICSCGWKSPQVGYYHNFQQSELARHERTHAKQARLGLLKVNGSP